MHENEVTSLLKHYVVSSEDIDRILVGLSKIRSNIDLLESDQPFEDDTRNLIKWVIKLAERTEPSPDVEKPDTVLVHCDPLLSPPLYVTGPREPGESFDDNYFKPLDGRAFGRLSSDQAGEIELFNALTSPTGLRTGYESHPSSCFSINPQSSPISFNTSTQSIDLTTQTLNRNSRRAKTPVQRFCRALSPVSYRVNIGTTVRNNVLDGGLSVPTTPVPKVYGTPVHQKSGASPAKGPPIPVFSNDATPPHSPSNFYPHFLQRNPILRDRQIRMPVTPPSKHRIKFTFPLHRSKSHESNLWSKIYVGGGGSTKVVGASPRHPRRFYTNNPPISPDSHSPGAAEANVFCFPTPTHGAIAPPSPKGIPTISRPEHKPNMIIPGGGRLAVPGNVNGHLLPVSGLTHRFENEAKFTDFVRGTPCAVCNLRLNLRFPHCVYCKWVPDRCWWLVFCPSPLN